MSDQANDLEQFRAETREWLDKNCPPEMRLPMREEDDACWGGRNWTFKNDAQKAWFDACVAKGYTVPDWPKEYGGAGLSPAEAKILEISPNPKEITATSIEWDLKLSSRQKMAVIYSYAVTRTESLGGL